MKKLKIQFKNGSEAVLSFNGMSVKGMHFDGIDEIEGTKEFHRASDVEFDAETQLWKAVIRPEFRQSHHHRRAQWTKYAKKRSDCIKWERKYLNRKSNYV